MRIGVFDTKIQFSAIWTCSLFVDDNANNLSCLSNYTGQILRTRIQQAYDKVIKLNYHELIGIFRSNICTKAY